MIEMVKSKFIWKEWRCRLYPSKQSRECGECSVAEVFVTAPTALQARKEAAVFFYPKLSTGYIDVTPYRTIIINENTMEKQP